MSTPTYGKRDIEKILKNNGWKFLRQNGSHKIYIKDGEPKHLTIGTCNYNKMVLQRLIKEYKLKI